METCGSPATAHLSASLSGTIELLLDRASAFRCRGDARNLIWSSRSITGRGRQYPRLTCMTGRDTGIVPTSVLNFVAGYLLDRGKIPLSLGVSSSVSGVYMNILATSVCRDRTAERPRSVGLWRSFGHEQVASCRRRPPDFDVPRTGVRQALFWRRVIGHIRTSFLNEALSGQNFERIKPMCHPRLHRPSTR